VSPESVGAEQLALEEPIVFGGKRPGQIDRQRRKVVGKNQVGRDGVALGSQIAQQAAEQEQMSPTGLVGKGRLLLAQGDEPAEHIGVAAQIGEVVQAGSGGLEKGKEAMCGDAIAPDGRRTPGEGKNLDLTSEDLLEGRGRGRH
jgi:hypothetical protein